MTMDRAIASGKEHRRPYRGSRAFDRSCRHGGSCSWCEGNRTVRAKREISAARDLLEPRSVVWPPIEP